MTNLVEAAMFLGYVPNVSFRASMHAKDGVLVIDWLIQNPPTQQDLEAAILPAAKSARIAKVKAERDRTKSEGVTVGENRFHSDADSRTQQLGLVIMGENVPPVQWKTMAGSFVTMTPTLAGQIFQATAARDMAVFGHAEALIAAISSAKTVEEVDAIDIATGWPK